MKTPSSKFGNSTTMNSGNGKSNTMSNMMTKPSSGQGSRVLSGTTYMGKKITINVNNANTNK